MSSNTSDNEVFEYMGNGQYVPKDVVSVRFHPSVVKVDTEAFFKCWQLKKVVLNEGLVEIGKQSFKRCTSLESVILPSTVTDIGERAFSQCTKLRVVLLNEGLQKIGNLFGYSSSLESITIPSSVIEIDEYAFYYSSLKKIVLNEGLVKIGDFAFVNCKLQDITIPSSLVEIGKHAFTKSGLREVVCSGELPKIEHDTFAKCLELERITFLNLSSRLEDIIQAGQVDIQNKIQQYMNQRGIEWRRGGTISIPRRGVHRTRDENPSDWDGSIQGPFWWGIVQEHFRRIVNLIKYYEMKEATSLFELALWKAKIDQVEDENTTLDRDECRIEVPGPVKNTIMQYLC